MILTHREQCWLPNSTKFESAISLTTNAWAPSSINLRRWKCWRSL